MEGEEEGRRGERRVGLLFGCRCDSYCLPFSGQSHLAGSVRVWRKLHA